MGNIGFKINQIQRKKLQCNQKIPNLHFIEFMVGSIIEHLLALIILLSVTYTFILERAYKNNKQLPFSRCHQIYKDDQYSYFSQLQDKYRSGSVQDKLLSSNHSNHKSLITKNTATHSKMIQSQIYSANEHDNYKDLKQHKVEDHQSIHNKRESQKRSFVIANQNYLQQRKRRSFVNPQSSNQIPSNIQLPSQTLGSPLSNKMKSINNFEQHLDFSKVKLKTFQEIINGKKWDQSVDLNQRDVNYSDVSSRIDSGQELQTNTFSFKFGNFVSDKNYNQNHQIYTLNDKPNVILRLSCQKDYQNKNTLNHNRFHHTLETKQSILLPNQPIKQIKTHKFNAQSNLKINTISYQQKFSQKATQKPSPNQYSTNNKSNQMTSNIYSTKTHNFDINKYQTPQKHNLTEGIPQQQFTNPSTESQYYSQKCKQSICKELQKSQYTDKKITEVNQPTYKLKNNQIQSSYNQRYIHGNKNNDINENYYLKKIERYQIQLNKSRQRQKQLQSIINSLKNNKQNNEVKTQLIIQDPIEELKATCGKNSSIIYFTFFMILLVKQMANNLS